ncbi:MAG: hypothetical protein QOE23_1155, partial [Pseudonocardiales bacterium]|nr:hypothetical protein [Pseudonocardiales bacterium]
MAPDRSATGLAERAKLEAALLRRRRGTGAIPALPRTGEVQRFPAGDSQRSMWLLDQVDPWPGARHIPEAVRVRGPLQLETLHLAMNDLVARHEVLRTSFELSGARLWQVVRPRLEVPLRLVDTTPDRLPELVRTEGEVPFDLERGPLIRLVVLRAGPQDHVLLVAMHHSIADGRSSEVMISDLTALYAARLQNLPAQLPELPIQFADYAVWQQDRLAGPHGARLTEYWQARLAGLPATRLPADLVPPRQRNWRSDNFVQPLPPELPGRVAELARRRRTTGFVVYLAGYLTLLASLSGDRDLAVSVPTAGRLRP